MKTLQRPTQETIDIRFIGARETERLVALSRWTCWRKEAEGTFPKSIKVGSKRVWLESEVKTWMSERIAERG
jgi:predicted DNA-binding transcriptional regulator AlpA